MDLCHKYLSRETFELVLKELMVGQHCPAFTVFSGCMRSSYFQIEEEEETIYISDRKAKKILEPFYAFSLGLWGRQFETWNIWHRDGISTKSHKAQAKNLLTQFCCSLSSLLLSSLPSPFCLGLEYHNGVDLSVWQELVLNEVLLVGPISTGWGC